MEKDDGVATTNQEKVQSLLYRLWSRRGEEEEEEPEAMQTTLVNDLLEIFTQQPHLVNQTYRIPKMSVLSFSPLHCFLEADCVDLEAVQALCCCSPDLEELFHIRHHGSLPIHTACVSSSDTIIAYLAAKMPPSCLANENMHGLFPFECIVMNRRHTISQSTMDMLVNNSAVRCALKESCEAVLTRAIRNGYPLHLLQLIVEAWPKEDQKSLVLAVDTTVRPWHPFAHQALRPLTLGQVQIICQLLHHLHDFHLDYDVGWEMEAFLYFLHDLETNHSLKNIRFMTLPNLNLSASAATQTNKNWILNSLRYMLIRNNTLQRLKLFCRADCGDIVQWWLKQINCGLRQNRGLVEFDLKVVTDRQSSICFLAQRKAPPSSSTTTGSALLEEGLTVPDSHSSLLSVPFWKAIWIRNTWPTAEAMNSLCDDLDLQQITFLHDHGGGSIPSRDQVTAVIVGVVERALSLTRLDILGSQIKLDLLPILQLLQQKETVDTLEYLGVSQSAIIESRDNKHDNNNRPEIEATCLELLQQNNLTLKGGAQLAALNTKIRYYLELNRNGRAVARHSASMNELVDVLAGVNTKFCLVPKDRASMLYGLLRESPGVWSRSTLVVEEVLMKPQQKKKKKKTQKRKLMVESEAAASGGAPPPAKKSRLAMSMLDLSQLCL